MWSDYFKLVKLVPGEVVIPGFGIIDFRKDNLPVELCKTLFEKDFEYLEITPKGKAKLYGIKAKTKNRRTINKRKTKSSV